MTLKKKYTDKTVLELARERVSEAFDRFDHISVSFSGGKDSTVVLNLCLEEARRRGRTPLKVVFYDEEALHPTTEQYVKRVFDLPDVDMLWCCIPLKFRNACSNREPWWWPWDPRAEEKWCRPMPTWATKAEDLPVKGYDMFREGANTTDVMDQWVYPDKLGSVCSMLGLRAQESLRRFRVVTKRETDNWISWSGVAAHVAVAKPIYDWTTEDVWTAPKLFNWDYNHTYDAYTALGISRHQQRVSGPFGQEPLEGLWQYGVLYPELWEKMQFRVAGARTALRYAKSPVYAVSGMPKKPEGMTWEVAIKKQLEQWPPAEQQKIAARMRREIQRHKELAPGESIPEYTPHKISALTWEFLYMLAVKGDLKGRKEKGDPAFYHKDVAFLRGDPYGILTDEDKELFRRQVENAKFKRLAASVNSVRKDEFYDPRKKTDDSGVENRGFDDGGEG